MTMDREIRADCGGEAGAADDTDREGGAGGDQEQPIARGQGHEEHPGRVQGDRQGRLGRLVRVCFRIRLHVVAEMDDGVLCVVRDYDEFKMAMDRLGLGLTATQCEQCIEVLDTDGDGEVSLSEFLVLVEKPAKTAAKAISAANAFAEAGKKAAPAPSNFAESVRRISPQPSRAERNSPLLLTIGTAGTNTSLRFFCTRLLV